MFPLINRTHYSIHRAFSKPREIAQKAKALGYEAVGLCDFGNVSAALEFIEECKSAKIKPIIGCDFGETYAFCKNLQGWKDLLSVVNEFSIHARLNRDTLANSPHLISFTGKLPDCRYVEKEDEEFYGILRCLGLKIKLSELIEETSGFHMVSPAEIPESPIYSEFDAVELFEIAAPPKLPKFSDGEVELLWTKVRAGLAQHTKNFDPIKKAEYDARVRYEMKVIELANLSGYFLIVSDFVNQGRADGQLCSIGRGSSAGCLVSDLIGINLVDPMPYGLLFSRFFNAARAYPKHLSFDEYPFIDEFRDFESIYLKELEEIHATNKAAD
jgi:DNA polymerase III alpha subunit